MTMATTSITTDNNGCTVQPLPTCSTCGDEGEYCPDCTPFDLIGSTDADCSSELVTGEGADPPGEPRMTLAELVTGEAAYYRSWSNDVGDLIAAALADLVAMVKFTRATTAAEYLDRLEALDRDLQA